MKGFIYRLGVKIKEFGEVNKLDFFIRFGISLRGYAANL